MKSIQSLICLAMGVVMSGHVAASPNVSVTISGQIQPGVYGRVQIGDVPPPPVVYAQPVVIVKPPPRRRVVEPLYLHVPPGHARNWRKHCRKYAACGQPVYFVRSVEYEPGYRRKHRHDDDRGQGRGRGHSHD